MYPCSGSHDNTCFIVRLVPDIIPAYMSIVLQVLYMCIVLPHVQEAFTCVLKGHIDLCSLVFPNKTHGKVKCAGKP